MTQDIGARFAIETAEHEMTIAHDNGLYRHLQFRHTGNCYSGYYWFDLITVPGSLIFRGDGESFVFARTEDMFDFFRSSAWEGRPNVGYWAEKVTSDRDRLKRYDEDLFRQALEDHLVQRYEPEPVPEAVREAVTEEILEAGYLGSEDEALRLASEFAYYENPDDRWKLTARPDLQFTDVWEWPVRGYDWWFLWACEAILWGIGKYDEAHGRKSRYVAVPPPVVDVELPDSPETEPPRRSRPMVTVELPGGAS